jgi:hemoglobin-like flavoprotein
MAQAEIQIAESSFHRCGEQPAFYEALYANLLASDPRIPPMFARTEFPRQYLLLKHALGLLIVYAKHPDPALLERIALRHARAGANVPPDLYPNFESALVGAVAAHDPKFTPAVGAAWRAVLAPGIAYMQSRYENGSA